MEGATGVADASGVTSGVTDLSAMGGLFGRRGRNRAKYMIFRHFRKPCGHMGWRTCAQ